VVKIDSVSSTAAATTDGVKSGGEAHTTVHGMTVGGQPATIDEHGLHIGSQDQPANAAANQVAQQALSKSGTSITLSQPSRETKDATTTVTAGSLVVSWNTGGGQIFTVTLGAADANVTAAPGEGAGVEGSAPPAAGDIVPGAIAGGVGGSQGAPADLGGSAPAVSASPSTPSSAGAVSGATASPSLKLASRGSLIPTGSVVLGLLAAALLALGMRRLGDRVLAEPEGVVCPLAEETG